MRGSLSTNKFKIHHELRIGGMKISQSGKGGHEKLMDLGINYGLIKMMIRHKQTPTDFHLFDKREDEGQKCKVGTIGKPACTC